MLRDIRAAHLTGQPTAVILKTLRNPIRGFNLVERITMTKDHSTNAEKLTTELIIVDKEMRENFREQPLLDDEEKDIIRRDTYLATIRRWMSKHYERDRDSSHRADTP